MVEIRDKHVKSPDFFDYAKKTPAKGSQAKEPPSASTVQDSSSSKPSKKGLLDSKPTVQTIKNRYKPPFIQKMEAKGMKVTLPPIIWPKSVPVADNKQAGELDRIWRVTAAMPEAILKKSPMLRAFLKNMSTLSKVKAAKGSEIDLSENIHEAEMMIWFVLMQMMKGGIEKLPRGNGDNYHEKMLAVLRNEPVDTYSDIFCQMLKKYPEKDRAILIKAIEVLYSDEPISPEIFTAEEAVESLQALFKLSNSAKLITDLMLNMTAKGKQGGLTKIGDRYYRAIPMGRIVFVGDPPRPEDIKRQAKELAASVRRAAGNEAQKAIDKRAEINEQIRHNNEDIQKIEDLLVVAIKAKEMGLNTEYVFKMIDNFNIMDLESVLTLAGEDVRTPDFADDLKAGKEDAINTLVKIVGERRAEWYETNIDISIARSITWNMEISRRVSEGKIDKDDADAIAAELENIFRKEDDSEGRVKFKEAEAYWARERGDLPSLLALPEILRKTKDYREWLGVYQTIHKIESNPYTNLATVQQTMRAQWLHGYAGWLKKTVSDPEFPFFGTKILPHAYVSAGVVFEPEDLMMPTDPRKLAAYNKKTGQNVNYVFKNVAFDQGVNKATMISAGVAIAVAGIVAGAKLRAAAIAGEVAFGWKIPSKVTLKLVWNTVGMTSLRAGTIKVLGWGLEFTAMTVGFTAGSTVASIPLAGFPTPEELLVDLGRSAVIFGLIEGAAFAAPFVTNFRMANGVRFIQETTKSIDDVVAMSKSWRPLTRLKGRWQLNAIHKAMGYHGSMAAMGHSALQFGAIVAILQNANIPLGVLGIDDPLAEEAHSGVAGTAQIALSLAAIMVTMRSIKINTRLLDKVLIKQNIRPIHQELAKQSMRFKELKIRWGDQFRLEGTINPRARMSEMIHVLGQIEMLGKPRLELLKQYAGSQRKLREKFEAQEEMHQTFEGFSGLLKDVFELSLAGEFRADGTLLVPAANGPKLRQEMMEFNRHYQGVFGLEFLGNGNGTLRFRFVQQFPDRPKELLLESVLFRPEPDMVEEAPSYDIPTIPLGLPSPPNH